MAQETHSYSLPEYLAPEIFRASDIRGIVKQNLTTDVVHAIGLAIGSEAQRRGQKQIIIARDGRLSSPTLITALFDGLLHSGRYVIDIGMVPTPMLYFATHWFESQCGVMLTGSHNPADYNGLKIVLGGATLMEGDIQRLYQRIIQRDFTFGAGAANEKEITADYIERIARDIKISRPLKIVVDAGNGVTGDIAPRLFRRLGCEVIELYCDIDGHFPHHHPDPSVAENLRDLQQAVLQHQADIGFAFDGDGDRLGVVTNKGEIIWPDRQMMLFAQDVLSHNPGAPILFDVKCTRHLSQVITAAGGNPVMWKTGHALLKSKLREINAPLGGEMSGHIFFKERWYGFDDGLYAGARLLEILSRDTRSSSEVFRTFPDGINTQEIKIPMADEKKAEFMQRFIESVHFLGARITTIDGLRADFSDAWGLVRASNTSPYLTLRFEADTAENLALVQKLFRDQLLKIDESLEIPF